MNYLKFHFYQPTEINMIKPQGAIPSDYLPALCGSYSSAADLLTRREYTIKLAGAAHTQMRLLGRKEWYISST